MEKAGLKKHQAPSHKPPFAGKRHPILALHLSVLSLLCQNPRTVAELGMPVVTVGLPETLTLPFVIITFPYSKSDLFDFWKVLPIKLPKKESVKI